MTATHRLLLLSLVTLILALGLPLAALAQEEGAEPPPEQQQPVGLLGHPFSLMLIIILIFWFVVLVPQRKQQKKHREQVSALKSGDRVLTSGGIYGTVRRRNDAENRITVEIAKGIQVEVAKSAISSIIPKEDSSGS
jgi:preprotein translocase subunit YajC